MIGLSIFSDASASGIAEIQLRSKGTVNDKIVRLKDVSDISHPDARIVDKLSRIKIAAAPQLGKKRWVTRRQVENGLIRSGIDRSQYRISGSGPASVKRPAAQVSAKRIRQAVKNYVLQNAPWDANQLKIREIKISHGVTVSKGKLSLQVQSPKHTDWLGSVPMTVFVLVDGQIVKKVTVQATIEVWSDVVLAARPLGKYQIIEPENTRIDKMNLARVPSNAILNQNEVLGSRTNRNIAANSILRSDQIELPPIVKRGDLVQVIAESNRMKISIQALAKQNGAKGELIRVQNLKSKKTIYAQVVDGQTLQVDF
jgi:flagella basal body P-ring formation protein FlgA